MEKPVVIVNFKVYEKGTGKQAVELAKICEEFGASVAVQATDIFPAAQVTSAGVYAQHVDAQTFGAHTGAIIPEAVKQAGAIGTLLNHSEKRLSHSEIECLVIQCKKLGLKTVVCANSIEEAEKLKEFNPDYLAVELPQFIGGDVSVMDADPTIIQEAVSHLGHNVLLGAGVHSGEDLKHALDGGAAGVLLASAIVKKTDDPRKALHELYSSCM